MLKRIMLTFLLCCATITFVGCENGKNEINSLAVNKNGNLSHSDIGVFESRK